MYRLLISTSQAAAVATEMCKEVWVKLDKKQWYEHVPK
jgi:hypothetical protein